jgi:hypothetical protein
MLTLPPEPSKLAKGMDLEVLLQLTSFQLEFLSIGSNILERMNDRFVLCMPAGGLNDVLCQIEKCWRYAERHGRKLVIDTAKTGLLDSFDQYFKVASPY